MSTQPTVHVVDDDDSFLRAVVLLLRNCGLRVEPYASPLQLLRALAPDARGCVIADLDMPEMNGLELQLALAGANVTMPVIILTGFGDVHASVRAIRGGASDFLEKSAPKEEMIAAIRTALDHDASSDLVRRRACDLAGRFARLTQREREVLGLVVRGRMNKEIAAVLGISERTVKLHRTAITGKIGVRSVAQLALLARESGFADASAPTYP